MGYIDDFKEKGRYPIIPLSLENVNLARVRELVFDYSKNQACIKNEDGSIINMTDSKETFQYILNYLSNYPDTLLDLSITCTDGIHVYTDSIKGTVADTYEKIVALTDRKYIYAASDIDSGDANSAYKVENTLEVTYQNKSVVSFDGSSVKALDIPALNLFKKSGGDIDGDINVLGKFVMMSNVTYGMGDPPDPSTCKEGQVYIKLIQEI